MTKKHFIALADSMVAFFETNAGAEMDAMTRNVLINALADFCQSQNSNFNREPWLGYVAGTNGKNGGTPAIVEIPAFVETTWELRTYDVWGNAKDGYVVNDTSRVGEVTIRCAVERNNADTPQEFLSAYPSDSQIRRALNLRRFQLELDGDDLTIYVNRAKDGYPLGEMHCTSHESVSPIREKQTR